MAEKKNEIKEVAGNRKAYHDYFVLESTEAGIELVGTEVKSLRKGACNLRDAWCEITPGFELLVNGMHISPYEQGNIFNRNPLRPRRLLMHKREIQRFAFELKKEGTTLIPLSVYFRKGRAKVQVGLCKGKKMYDKRAVAAERDAKRDIDRAMKNADERL